MTVDNVVDWVFYSGDGTATVFPFPFKIFAAADLRVVLIDADDVPDVQVITTEYTIPVADLGSSEGNVTMLTAPPTGSRLLVRRKRPLEQGTRIRDNGVYNAGLHENAIDVLLMQTQGLQYSVSRSVQFPETEETAPDVAVLPSAAERANKYIKFDADGNPEYVTDAVSETSKHWTREGDLTTTSNALFGEYTAFQSETYTRLHIRVHTAPTGSPVVVEILKNGTTVIGSVSLPAGSLSALAEGLAMSLVNGDYIQPQIASVGSSTPGTTMTLTLRP